MIRGSRSSRLVLKRIELDQKDHDKRERSSRLVLKRIELDKRDHDKRVKVIEVSIEKNRTRPERPR